MIAVQLDREPKSCRRKLRHRYPRQVRASTGFRANIESVTPERDRFARARFCFVDRASRHASRGAEQILEGRHFSELAQHDRVLELAGCGIARTREGDRAGRRLRHAPRRALRSSGRLSILRLPGDKLALVVSDERHGNEVGHVRQGFSPLSRALASCSWVASP